MHIHADGSFEIIASGAPQTGNWLRMTPETRSAASGKRVYQQKQKFLRKVRIERIDLRQPAAPFICRAR